MERSEYETTKALSRKQGPKPAAPEKPYLTGIAGEHAGRFFPLDGLHEIAIGRTVDCEITVAMDDLVSRRHARIEIDPAGTVWLRDLDSTNGTLVNGREVKHPVLLHRGDRIFLGDSTIFKLDYLSDDELARWQAASLDPLTECFNRAFFNEHFGEFFELARTRNRSLSLVMLDIDYFKTVNDRHGHQGGDFVLQQVAATIQEHLTHSSIESTACRYGGEEFAILLPGTSADTCARIAEQLRLAVAGAALEFEGEPISLTLSAGTATFLPRQFERHDQLLRVADDNLYQAKRDGRNRVVSMTSPTGAEGAALHDQFVIEIQRALRVNRPASAARWLHAVASVLADWGGRPARSLLAEALGRSALSGPGSSGRSYDVLRRHAPEGSDTVLMLLEAGERADELDPGKAALGVGFILAAIKTRMTAEQVEALAVSLPPAEAARLRGASAEPPWRYRLIPQSYERPRQG